jgi:hypothetical protein
MQPKEGYKERDYSFIKKIIDDSIKPIVDITLEHHIALNGNDKRSGIIKDINDLKLGIFILRWLIGIGFSVVGLIFAAIGFFK